MEPFQVLMVGPTRVGKTSTLASMTEALQQEVNKLQYHTTIPDQLIMYHDEFVKTCDKNDFVVKQLPMKEGTGNRTDYRLEFFSQNNENDITINFIDVPGGWFIPPIQDSPNIHYDEIKEMLKSSIASMWCVDCVSMVEGKNDPDHDYHTERNEPKLIAELYKNLPSISTNHRLIFVLMRAETYLVNKGQGADWLLKKFSDYYSQYINEIKHRFPEIEIYVTAVQTLGCFKFKSWQRNANGELEATYIKYTPPGKYSPKNCEAPALLAIDRALQESVQLCEQKKSEMFEFFKKNCRGPLGRLAYWLIHILGDSTKMNRYADIFDLLKAGKPVLREEFPIEFEAFPDLNAHITLERLKKAADSMGKSVEQKQRDDDITLL